jgi:hypothetical protein
MGKQWGAVSHFIQLNASESKECRIPDLEDAPQKDHPLALTRHRSHTCITVTIGRPNQ